MSEKRAIDNQNRSNGGDEVKNDTARSQVSRQGGNVCSYLTTQQIVKRIVSLFHNSS